MFTFSPSSSTLFGWLDAFIVLQVVLPVGGVSVDRVAYFNPTLRGLFSCEITLRLFRDLSLLLSRRSI